MVVGAGESGDEEWYNIHDLPNWAAKRLLVYVVAAVVAVWGFNPQKAFQPKYAIPHKYQTN